MYIYMYYLQVEYSSGCPISLNARNIRDILDENKEMDHDCFNLVIRMAAQNKFLLTKNQKQKYHFMDLQFAVSSSNC